MTLDEMKRIARAAADGRWRRLISSDGQTFFASGPQHTNRHVSGKASSRAEADATFIATFNPVMVRQLLAVVEAANDPRLKVMAPHTMEQIGLTKALADYDRQKDSK